MIAVAISGDEGGVPEIAQEGEALEKLGVVLEGQPHALHGLALVDGDAQPLAGIGGVDHLRLQAHAADLRQHHALVLAAGHAEQRQGLVVAFDHHGLLLVGQEGGG
jgi:hypothetical protein